VLLVVFKILNTIALALDPTRTSARPKKGALMQDIHVEFPHRHNADGTYDSICRRCFRTIATERVEEDLKAEELAHHCWKWMAPVPTPGIATATAILLANIIAVRF